MAVPPKSVADFLRGERIAVAGVSRSPNQAANAVLRKLRKSGYDVVPINPKTTEAEGEPCYPDLESAPGRIDGVVVVTHPDVAGELVDQCLRCGIDRVWFHRSFGSGSVSEEAVRRCEAAGIEPIVGGCPLMFCEPVDLGHRCMRWWLQRRGRVPS